MNISRAVFIIALVFPLLSNTGGFAIADEPEPGEIKIVFIAYENPDQLIDDVEPVISYLEEKMGMAVKYYVATDYAGVVEAIRNKSADFGFMGPLQYVLTHDQTGAYPILGELYGGKATYRSRIFVRHDSGIEGLGDLRGKTIAFVDPISSSGYMYPLDIFVKEGLMEDKDEADNYFRRVYFAGGDEQAIRAVLNGFVDAAGIGQYAYFLLTATEREEMKYIAESGPIPSHCLVAREGINGNTVEKLKNALLSLKNGPDKGLLKNLYNVDGYIEVSHDDYEEVEDMAREYGFIRES